MTPKQVLQLVKSKKVEFVDCRFMTFPGGWEHTTLPAKELNESSFTEGFGFDGSSLRGWAQLNEGDMLLVPVADTAQIDPFHARPTLGLICDVKDPVTRKSFSRDPRSIARRAAAHLKKTKVADTAYFGPEIEFFIFDGIRYGQRMNHAVVEIDAAEGVWNRSLDTPGNQGNQIRPRRGQFPCPPVDTLHDLRSEMVALMMEQGLDVEEHHHEVAGGGQCEIDLRHQDLVKIADACLLAKYVVKNVAHRYGKVATFMPKPLFGDNGSGMHLHFSLWKGGKPLFGGRKYAGLSQMGLYAIGGILKHAPSLMAFTNPTTNSYKRLIPGYEAPIDLTYSSRNRTSAIRIPVYSPGSNTKRLEFRAPDPACNPYLAFSATLMAALDGIQNKIDPGDPVDISPDRRDAKTRQGIARVPVSLNEALDALEQDHAYLLEGGVFGEDVVKNWVHYKRETEVDALRQRPHPYEFCMYFDA
ncbi:MAG: type I glutamate--ammonia ligase [Algisphaera sp.]